MEQSIRFRAVFPALVGLWFAFASAAVEEHPGQSQDHTIRSLLHSRAKVDRRGEGNDYVSNEILIKFRQEAAEKLAFGLQQGKPIHQIQITRSLDVVNQKYGAKTIGKLFGRFREDQENIKSLRRKDKTLLSRRERRLLQRLERAPKEVRIPELDRIFKLTLDLAAGQSLPEVVAAYQNDPAVEYAELNYIVSLDITPNDPHYPMQWSLDNTGQIYPASGIYNEPPGTSNCDIDAPETWDVYTGGSGIIVAVVDTGVDYNHRDLDENMWINEAELSGDTGIDDDGNGYIDDIYGYDFVNGDNDPIDDNGHGTHCAGSIAAEGDNGLDITGVCWDARIMALKFLDWEGYGNTNDAAAAFYYAVAHGAEVVSNSWGGGEYSQTMEEAIAYAHSQGVILAAAAGNDYTDEPQYPARYAHMIAVAATDSNDEKPSFSNYGEWVDLAAPGVDILSLRASGTALGTIHDDYTTIASGTSMACPHVAAGCALLLSVNPLITVEEMYDVLMATVDPIAEGICLSDGRLNLFSAMQAIVPSAGRLRLDHDYYSCSSEVSISLADGDLAGQGSQEVVLTTTGGDVETLLLTEEIASVGVFTGTISTASRHLHMEDGTLQVSHGEIITAIYEDSNDGTGNPATVTDTAEVDCKGPVISNVQIGFPGREPKVTFDTDEPATGRVLCGKNHNGPYTIVASSLQLTTHHILKLIGVESATDYYLIVEATDVVGNLTEDDNSGAGYTFTTTGIGDIYVPSEVFTIQEAVDNCWDGGSVILADGIYTGEGNRDVDFKRRIITVSSETAAEYCIIDCEGDPNEPHRGLYFHQGEGTHSIVRGVTITNGYAELGGGISCNGSSPTIENCIIRDCSAQWGGGMDNSFGSSPTLTNCTFTGNTAEQWGGGIENWVDCNSVLIHCTFRDNAAEDGGAMSNDQGSDVTMVDCTFNGNSTIGGGGGGVGNYFCDPTYINCTFNHNIGEGMFNTYSEPTIINCTFSGNSDAGMYNSEGSPVVINCVFRGNAGNGMENGYAGAPEVTNCIFNGNADYGMRNWAHNYGTVTNCTFVGNNGGMNTRYSEPIVTNCIFWDNGGADESLQICNVEKESVVINYSCVQGWTGILGGTGNTGEDPLFVEANGADEIYGTEDDDLRLLGGSPCIDAGDNIAVPEDSIDLDDDNNTSEPLPWDLDRNPRFMDDPNIVDTGNPPGADAIVDMGAYEAGKQGFLLSTKLITIPEGLTAAFTVVLALDPGAEVEVSVAVVSGDSDITVASGGLLIFNSSNYSEPQIVTLAAAEDVDYFHGTARIRISAAGFVTAGISAYELDNDVPPILYVDGRAGGINNGTSWTDAFTDLQEALSAAAVCPEVEEIRVAQGEYRPADPNGNRNATFQLINGVAMYGGYAGLGEADPNNRDIELYETILSGDLNDDDIEVADPADLRYEPTRAENSIHVVTANGVDATTILEGFVITSGNANDIWGEYNTSGGGMYNISSSPTLRYCTFRSNSASSEGGGMCNHSSNPTLTNCTFSGNSGIDGSGGSGGGIFNYRSSPVMSNCTFEENVCGGGGGGIGSYFYCHLTLINCTFSDNSAYNGGGMYNYHNSDTVLNNCTFSGNSAARHGGAIYHKKYGSLTLSNCTISGNNATSRNISGYGGGGISFWGDFLTINDCIIAHNSAIWSGGGIYCHTGTTMIDNCFFIGNAARKGSGTPSSDGGAMYNCDGPITNCTIVGNSTTDRGGALYDCDGAITNCIIWENLADMGPHLYDSSVPAYSCIQNWAGGGTGNMGHNPLFSNPGNNDYHLKSEIGRWDAVSQSWVKDALTSPCIDAGDPASDWSIELWPHGGRINMGAYGNTPEASMSSELIGNIADLNHDDMVNLEDYSYWVMNWMKEEILLAADLDRNGKVDLPDAMIFLDNWLRYEGAEP